MVACWVDAGFTVVIAGCSRSRTGVLNERDGRATLDYKSIRRVRFELHNAGCVRSIVGAVRGRDFHLQTIFIFRNGRPLALTRRPFRDVGEAGLGEVTRKTSKEVRLAKSSDGPLRTHTRPRAEFCDRRPFQSTTSPGDVSAQRCGNLAIVRTPNHHSCLAISTIDLFAKGSKLRRSPASFTVTTIKFVARGGDLEEMRPTRAIRNPPGAVVACRPGI
jgi:hypothetical protein